MSWRGRGTSCGPSSVCRWANAVDQRERGTRIFIGLAAALLADARGEHLITEAWRLAWHLAAPPVLVGRVGIDAAVGAQPWAKEDFLRVGWAVYALRGL